MLEFELFPAIDRNCQIGEFNRTKDVCWCPECSLLCEDMLPEAYEEIDEIYFLIGWLNRCYNDLLTIGKHIDFTDYSQSLSKLLSYLDEYGEDFFRHVIDIEDLEERIKMELSDASPLVDDQLAFEKAANDLDYFANDVVTI